MLDGPQGLAKPGSTLRQCERLAGAVGKTPDTRPQAGRPFATYINSSLDLFWALHKAGITVGPTNLIDGVCEVYPGHIWSLLAPGTLPKKSSRLGREARKRILEALGIVDLPELPTHDQNDACISALVAAAVDGVVPGVQARVIGFPVTIDGNLLREGQMVVPDVNELVRKRIADALADIHIVHTTERIPAPVPSHVANRAIQLLQHMVQKAQDGDPEVCTYSCAYQHIFSTPI